MKRLIELYKSNFHTEPINIEQIKGSGSDRKYYRLSDNYNSSIGVIGTSLEENKAFIGITKHFNEKKLPVPQILAVSPDYMAYLQTDLGKLSLYDKLAPSRESGFYNETDVAYLEDTIKLLPLMQIRGKEGLDLSLCFPTSIMDETAIHFDLNYFKYCFLKLLQHIEFNEIMLENDFCKLSSDIIKTAEGYNTLMLRDFQSRNVMLCKKGNTKRPYFIDYQGCRLGPKEYDLASFLWQSSAKYPSTLRNRLVDTYIKSLSDILPTTDPDTVRKNLRLMVLFRLLQVLGAYGFRGYIEHKAYFLNSIPLAINNIKELVDNGVTKPYPYLEQILCKIIIVFNEHKQEGKPSTTPIDTHKQGLTVTVYSFSYKKGIPIDTSGNGGGYVFDCRSTHNPGRFEEYKKLTGLDEKVIKYLEDDGEITTFLSNIYPIVNHHVTRFLERHFTHLMICFGCTGGQHRSVYSAQHVAEYIHNTFTNVNVHLIHREQGIEKFI